MLYMRIHYDKVSENEFLRNASTWYWAMDGEGRMYEEEVSGVYSAVETLRDLVGYIDRMSASDDHAWVAIFEGEEAKEYLGYAPEPFWGEKWVRPRRLVGWLKPGEVLQVAKRMEDEGANLETVDAEALLNAAKISS